MSSTKKPFKIDNQNEPVPVWLSFERSQSLLGMGQASKMKWNLLPKEKKKVHAYIQMWIWQVKADRAGRLYV